MAVIDPEDLILLKEKLWPQVTFYGKQLEIIESTLTNRETHVPAGNKLGKDFIAAYIVLGCFLVCQARGITCRIVTTSVAEHHLKVLWGEIGRFIATCQYQLMDRTNDSSDARVGLAQRITVNHQEVRRAEERDVKNPLSYLVGRVSEHGEGLAGHHAEFTLLVGDESSGLVNKVHEMGQGWAQHMLFLGNPNPCENFWQRACDELDETPGGYKDGRRLIRIAAEDSPNVAHERQVLPGVLTKDEYDWRMRNWDELRKCVGLAGRFYRGAEVKLFPKAWLDAADRLAIKLRAEGRAVAGYGRARQAKAIGIDPGEGTANTTFAAGDDQGLIELVSLKTPDTTAVVSQAIDFGRRHNVPPEQWYLDRGGGGKQHADRLRQMGYNVRTVAFGEPINLEPKRGLRMLDERKEHIEERYSYKNRRGEMYGTASTLLDPSLEELGGYPDAWGGRILSFAIPQSPLALGIGVDPRPYQELRRQLLAIPKWYDPEGRLEMPAKQRRPGEQETKRKTLVEMLGCSPDEADAFVLMVYGLTSAPRVFSAGAVV